MEIDKQEPTDSQSKGHNKLRDLLISVSTGVISSLNATEQTLLRLRFLEKQPRKRTGLEMGISARKVGTIERRILGKIDLRLSNTISRIPEAGTIFDREINLQNRKPLNIPSYK